MNMYVQRLLNTDGLEFNNVSKTLIVGEPIDFIYAGLEKANSIDDYSKISAHAGGNGFSGNMQIKIESTGYVNQLNVFDLYVVHGIVFAVCWGLLALLQIAAARWLKMYHNVSMWIHRITGFLIFVGTFVMAMFTFKQDEWEIKPGYHPAMGLTIVITMSLLTIGGITARMILEKSRWNTVLALRIKLGHKLFGCVVMFLA